MRFLPHISLTAGMMLLVQSTLAQEATIREPPFLQSFDGSYSGSGTLKRATDPTTRALTCTFRGSSGGTRIALVGRCSAGILSTSSTINIRVDPRSQGVTGSYRDGMGTIATLSGSRHGGSLVLAFNETAESVNPGPPARLTIGQSGSQLSLSLRSSKPDAGQNLDLTLQKQ
jgi:hypothetical protein